MNLHQLSDENLDSATVRLVTSERELLIEILKHLREVERRRLFSKYGFSSLFDYAIKRLRYSEDQAARRISAMRLLKELPSIEKKVENGALTLTHLSKAQTLFRNEKKASVSRTSAEKLELLSKIEKTSKREAEKIFEKEISSSLSGGQVGLTDQQIGFAQKKISLDQLSPELQKKLARLLEVRSHVNSEMDLEKLLNEIADLGLEKWDPLKKAERVSAKTANGQSQQSQKRATDQIDAAIPAPVRVATRPAERSLETARRYIPSAYRHAVWVRDEGKCRNCGSKTRVEIDHIKPFAKGGKLDLQNLRLLCRNCNQRHAIEQFGSKMSSYLRSPFINYLN